MASQTVALVKWSNRVAMVSSKKSHRDRTNSNTISRWSLQLMNSPIPLIKQQPMMVNNRQRNSSLKVESRLQQHRSRRRL